MTKFRRAVLGAIGAAGIGGLVGYRTVLDEFEDGNNAWTHLETLTAEDAEVGDNFGFAVGLSSDGTTAIVGAPHHPNDYEHPRWPSGAVYVFERDGETWTRQAKLTADDGDSGDEFGRNIELFGDENTALVDAPFGDAVYVIARGDETWNQEAKLTDPFSDSKRALPTSIELSKDGRIAVICGPTGKNHEEESAELSYIFERSGGTWASQATLAPEDVGPDVSFGTTLGLSDDGGPYSLELSAT